ncbi:MAG: response regulator [Deltaproteobacteria bacterium]|nr:response regulator [Deltaproteobacteria bacterium]
MPKAIILILDPEVHTQWVLKTLLEFENYRVFTVDSIEDAIINFSKFEISGLITEFWVNCSSTLEVIREFKKLFPEAYVMMLANGEVQESEYCEIIEAGVDDFFLKPFSIHKVLLHLRKGLKHYRILVQNKGSKRKSGRNLIRNELR